MASAAKAETWQSARQKLEAKWGDAGRAAIANHEPVALTGKDAKYNWLHHIAKSSLAASSRLVAHTLCLHGRETGTSIFPSTRTLAAESGLSEHTVCDHLEQLVRRGYLWRSIKNTGRDWSATIFTLCVPKAVLEDVEPKEAPWVQDVNWKPDPGVRGAEPTSVPQGVNGSRGTELTSVPQDPLRDAQRDKTTTEALHSASEALHSAPRGTELSPPEALKPVQRSLRSYSSKNLSLRDQCQRASAPTAIGKPELANGSRDPKTALTERRPKTSSRRALPGYGPRRSLNDSDWLRKMLQTGCDFDLIAHSSGSTIQQVAKAVNNLALSRAVRSAV